MSWEGIIETSVFLLEEPRLAAFLVGGLLCLWEERGEKRASRSTQISLNSA